MKYIHTFLNKGKILIFLLTFTFILTIINFIWPLSNTINSLIGLIVILLYSFKEGINVGSKVSNKGFLEGLKTGALNVLILYILGLILGSYKIILKKLIYYMIIILMSMLGSIIGINNRKNA